MTGGWQRISGIFGLGYVALMLSFIYLPVAVLILFAFQASSAPVPPFDGPSLRWFDNVVHDVRMMDALRNSVYVAGASAFIATVFGSLAAYGVIRSGGHFAKMLQGFYLAPLTISYAIIAMGLLMTFLRVGIPKSLTAIIIGHAVINLPISFAMVYSQFKHEFIVLERAARDLGAKEWQVLWFVTLPNLVWPVVGAYLLSFTLSWDEFIIALLVSRFDVTLPVEIWSQLRAGLSPKANAIGALVFLVSSAIVILTAVIFSLGGRRRKQK